MVKYYNLRYTEELRKILDERRRPGQTYEGVLIDLLNAIKAEKAKTVPTDAIPCSSDADLI